MTTAVLDSKRSANELRRAIAVLRQHCLKQSSAFCAEQLVGLTKDDVSINGATLYSLSQGAGGNDSMEVDETVALATLKMLESEPVLAQVFLKLVNIYAQQTLLARLLDYAGPEKAQAQAMLREVRAMLDNDIQADFIGSDGGFDDEDLDLT